jgi:hypothetical protein
MRSVGSSCGREKKREMLSSSLYGAQWQARTAHTTAMVVGTAVVEVWDLLLRMQSQTIYLYAPLK